MLLDISAGLERCGERLGAMLAFCLATYAQEQEIAAAIREAMAKVDKMKRDAEGLAEVAAYYDGHVLTMDGGPSTFGVRDWYKSLEKWGSHS
jgi:hypothetical protein